MDESRNQNVVTTFRTSKTRKIGIIALMGSIFQRLSALSVWYCVSRDDMTETGTDAILNSKSFGQSLQQRPDRLDCEK